MKESPQKNRDEAFHPYVFVLKEGIKIHENFLDYSLLLLVGKPEVFSSSPQKKVYPLISYQKTKK